VWNIGGVKLTEEKRNAGTQNVSMPQYQTALRKNMWTGRGLLTVLRGERPAIDCMNKDRAIKY